MRIVSRLFSFLVFVDAFSASQTCDSPSMKDRAFSFPASSGSWCSPKASPLTPRPAQVSVSSQKSGRTLPTPRLPLSMPLGIVVEHNVDLRSQSQHSVPVGCIAEAMHSWRIRKLKTGYRPVSSSRRERQKVSLHSGQANGGSSEGSASARPPVRQSPDFTPTGLCPQASPNQ